MEKVKRTPLYSCVVEGIAGGVMHGLIIVDNQHMPARWRARVVFLA